MMLYSSKNGVLNLDGTTVDYIRFGSGGRNLVILPGLGDGLKTVKGTALPMALMYRMFAKDFTVYAFSRAGALPEGSTTRDMAQTLARVMDAMGISCASILGVSMGGMIAQHFAIDYPERVEKLVLTVTCPGPNPILEGAVKEWISLAQSGNHGALMASNLRLIYSESYCRKNGWMIPFVGLLTKPKSYDRFLIQARACLTHDAREGICRIQAPTLVVGGEKDHTLGAEASRELAAAIPGARLRLYPEWGHGLYEEAPDFNKTVLEFLLES